VALSADGGDSTEPTISANGLKVAFTSENPNLVAGDTNGVADAFVYTVFPAGVERVSVGAAGLQSDGASSQALISGDGTVVAFHSAATNLGDPNGDSFYRHVGGTTSAFFADPPDTAANEWLSTLRDIDYDGDRFAFQRIVSTFDCTIIGCFWLDSPAVRYIDATGAPLINAAAIPPAAPGDSYLGLPMARPYFSSVDMLPQISDDGMVGSFVAAKTNFAFDFALYATDLDGSVPTLASDQPDDNVLHVAMSGDADILAVSTHPTWVIATSGRVSGRLAVAPTVSGVVADGPVVAGATVNMTVSGANFGETLLLLNSFGGFLSNVVVVDESTATGVLTIPAATAPGSYDIGALVSRLGLLGQGVCEGCLIVG